MEPQARARDQPERALRADHQVERVGPAETPREPHAVAGAEHAIGAPHHVFDLAVAARALTGAARCQPTTNRGAQNARRKMPDREPLAFQRGFQIDTEHTSLDVDHTLVGQHAHLRQPLRVDDDRARAGPHRTAHPAAGPVGHQADALTARHRDDRFDLLRVLGPDDERRLWPALGAARLLNQVPRPGVTRRRRPIDRPLTRGNPRQELPHGVSQIHPGVVPPEPRDVYRSQNARFVRLLLVLWPGLDARSMWRRRRHRQRPQVGNGRRARLR